MATTTPPPIAILPLRKRWRLLGGCLGCLGLILVSAIIAGTVGLMAWAFGFGDQDFYMRAQIPYWIILIVFVFVLLVGVAVALSASVGKQIQRFFN